MTDERSRRARHHQVPAGQLGRSGEARPRGLRSEETQP